MATVNPIRDIVDKLDFNSLPKEYTLIQLSIGDPSKYGNLPVPKSALKILSEKVLEGESNGYLPSHGSGIARKAISDKYNEKLKQNKDKLPSLKNFEYTQNDVFITSGCSDALNIGLCSLLDKGDTVLLPKPGFSLYVTLCGRYGIKTKFYQCLPDKQWQIDLKQLETLVDDTTKCILLNNPSNPCGSVYSKEHLKEICEFAYKNKLVILADEIYADMVFEKETFTSCGAVSTGPIYLLGGLAKQYLAPGWRVGWIVLHDPENKCSKVRGSLLSLTQVILGANSVCQAALPSILHETKPQFYKALNMTLGYAAQICFKGFESIPELEPVKPQGAMYMMVKINIDKLNTDINDDVRFCQLLLKEKAVCVLPGCIFNCPNFFRVVLCPPPYQIREAIERIKSFCDKYSLKEEVERIDEILLKEGQKI